MNPRSVARRGWMLIALLAISSGAARAQQASDAATPAYAAAVELQRLESYKLAAEAWSKFLKEFPSDPRVDRAHHYLGVCRLKEQQPDQAIAALQTVIGKYPQSEVLEPSYLYLGVAQYSLGQAGKAEMYDAAAATLDTLMGKYPQGKHLSDAMFYRAECFYLRGKKQEAAGLYAQFLAKYPTHKFVADATYALGVSQEELGQTEAAGKTYDDFLARFPENRLTAEVVMRRGLTLVAGGAHAQAIPWLANAAARTGFKSADLALLRQAEAMVQLKQYAEAAAVFTSLPAKFPQSPHVERARLLAGRCLYLAGSFAEARKGLDGLLAATGPTAAEAAHWIALSWLKEGQPAQALAVADKVLAQAGQNVAAAQLAMDAADALYEIPTRRKESIDRYAAVAAKHPQDPLAPQAMYLAGYVALELGDYAAGLKHANAFLAAYPNHELAVDVRRVAAEATLQLGKYAEADKLYADLIQRQPNHADVETWKVRRMVAVQMQQKHQETATALETTLNELRTPDARAEALYLLGCTQLALNQPDAAVKSFTGSLAAQPRWRQADDAWLLLAHAYRQLNDLANAKASLKKMIEMLPGSKLLDRAHYRLGEYSYASGDFATAAAAYRQVIDLWPQSSLAPNAMHELGCSQLSQKDAQGAEQTLTQFLEKYAQHALVFRARYARGMARQQLEKFAPATEDLQAVLAATPAGRERSDARYLLGLCQVGLKQHAAAVGTFQTLLQEDPKYPGADNARYQLAWAMKLSGKEVDAAKAFAQLAADFPNSPWLAEAQHHVGEHAYQNKDYASAAAAYHAVTQKAAGTDLGEKAAHKLGWSFYHLGDFERAEQTFRYQGSVYPQAPLAQDAAFMVAECLFKQGKHAEALTAYAQVRNPSSKDFQVLASLHAGQAAGQLKQWQQGLQWLTRAAEQFPDSTYLPEILYEQGWAQQNLGRIDEAVALYQQVIAKSGREAAARAQFMIGEIQFERKQHDKAVESFVKVAYGYSYPKWQGDATFEAARCFEVMGMTAQAMKLYQELLQKYPQSDKAAPANQRLDELKKR